jgi:S-formylglutathione hydrolase
MLSEHRCFQGIQGFYRHSSKVIGLPMRFTVFRPPQAEHGPVPVLFYLALKRPSSSRPARSVWPRSSG